MSISKLIAADATTEDPKKLPPNEKWKKKDIRDYSDADMERLYEQWEEDDEPLEPDELPEWKRPAPQIDLSKIDMSNPESITSASKAGRTLMMFATVSGNPLRRDTEQITRLWESSLFNAHYNIQRYIVSDNKAVFVVEDGAKAWPIKDFLVKQERCEKVTIDGTDYPGLGSKQHSDTKTEQQKTNLEKKKEDGVKVANVVDNKGNSFRPTQEL